MNKGLIYFLLSMSCIGLILPLGGELMTKFPVWLFNFMTVGIAVLILVPFATIYEKTKWTKLGKKVYIAMFLQAFLTCTLYNVFLLYGLTYANAIAAGIITSITPAVVFILALFLLRERLNIRKVFAIVLAIIAVLIMNIAGVEVEGGSSSLGIMFMLLAVISMSLFFIYAKKLAVELKPITMSAILCFFGFIQLAPMGIYEFTSYDLSIVTINNWFGVVFYGVCGWALAYVFTYAGLQRINASTAGMATSVIPIVATIVAVAFYGAAIRIVDVIALILVIVCIYIAEIQGNKDVPSPEITQDNGVF